MHFVDRQAKYPNRWTLQHADGTSEIITLIRNDEPIVPGTPMNAETLNTLSDVAGADIAKEAAEAAAAEAMASQNAAKASEDASKESETLASQYKDASLENRNASAKSAKASANSASASAESQRLAALSETAAGKHEATAKEHMDASQASAEKSAESETNAATSETNAAASAKAASASQTAAASSAAAALESQNAADASASSAKESETVSKEYLDQVKTITLGAQGWYETPDALAKAVPIGENGWWAVVGSTDTIWVWDSDTSAWKDTFTATELGDYYTREQVDGKLAGKSDTGHTHLYAGSDTAGGKANSAKTADSVDWANVAGKPETFPPSGHNHDDRYYTESEVDTKLGAKANDDSVVKSGHVGDYSTDTAASMPSYMGSYSDANAFYNVISIRHRNGQSDGNLYGLLIRSGLTWDDSLHFRHQTGNGWLTEKTLLDNGNYNNYALPLTGGTMNGNLHFANVGDTGTSAGITFAGSTDGAGIYYQTTGADQGNLVLNLTDDSNCYLRIAKNGKFKSYFSPDDGNFHGNVNGRADTAGIANVLNVGGYTGGANQIYASGVDGANPVGGYLNNIVIQSWRGVSFVSDCHDGKYGGTGKTAVGIDCRNGIVYADRLEGAINWNSLYNKPSVVKSVKYSNGYLSVQYADDGPYTSDNIGGIAASGSNYVRFTDGTQICWNVSVSATGVSGHYRGNWPVAFVNTSYFVFNENTKNANALNPTEKGTTYCDMESYWVHIAAIGRWK